MMRNVFLLLMITILTWCNSYSQNLELGFWTGLGTYNMQELKTIQEDLLSEIRIPNIAITESFPAYANFGANLGFNLENFIITALFRYESTGSRIAYSDYSGSYFYDQLAKQILFGSSIKIYSNKEATLSTKKIKFLLEVKAGIGLSSVTFKDRLKINDETIINSLKLEETSAFAEPGLGFSVPFGKLKIEPILSFFIEPFKSGLHLPNNSDAKLMNSDGEVNSQWSGLRFGINLIVIL